MLKFRCRIQIKTKERFFYEYLNTLSLESNRQIKINFDGGDLSSDAGLLLIKEFAAKIGFMKLIKKYFKTNDMSVRFHKDDENLMQMIYQIISTYFEDDCADELTCVPVFNSFCHSDSKLSKMGDNAEMCEVPVPLITFDELSVHFY